MKTKKYPIKIRMLENIGNEVPKGLESVDVFHRADNSIRVIFDWYKCKNQKVGCCAMYDLESFENPKTYEVLEWKIVTYKDGIRNFFYTIAYVLRCIFN